MIPKHSGLLLKDLLGYRLFSTGAGTTANFTHKFPGLKNCVLIVSCILFSWDSIAQDTTIITLEGLRVEAFGHDGTKRNIAAPVIKLSEKDFERFGPNAVLTAINSSPGIRMEERSPGSYRLNIRGSSIRAPFGVRNVKIYLNGLPVTDPGGQSYFNQFGSKLFRGLEIIKGPSSSLYGAGTGGVLLINSLPRPDSSLLSLEYMRGSFGLSELSANLTLRDNSWNHAVLFQQQSSNGYRVHSSLNRYNVGWFGNHRAGESNDWTFSFLFGDLEYQTPGGLTLSEYIANPRSSRPASGNFPSAVTARAGIHQQQFLAGFTNQKKWSSKLRQNLAVYGQYTLLENPAIQNFGENDEPHTGARLSFNYSAIRQKAKWVFDLGAEVQKGFATLKVYNNVSGEAGKLRTLDKVKNLHALLFSQVIFESDKFIYTVSASLNDNRISYQRFDSSTAGLNRISFRNQFSPRASVLYKGTVVNPYISIAKGYSPPTTAEMFPSGNTANPGLSAETGTNIEAGFKGNLLSDKFNFDISIFRFELSNSIVQRRTAGGGDYYINAGKIKQYGIESGLKYQAIKVANKMDVMFELNHSFHHFRYAEFIRLNSDYSGNKLPGQPEHQLSAISEIRSQIFSATLNYLFNSRSALDDANSGYADQWSVAGIKFSYVLNVKKSSAIFFAGIENIFDKEYSLGNDINAFGGRYYNIAPGRTYYMGMKLLLSSGK